MIIHFINISNKKTRLININTNLFNDITFSSDEVSIDYGNKVQVLKYKDYLIQEFIYDKTKDPYGLIEHKTNTEVLIENMMSIKFKTLHEYKIEKFNEGKPLININEELGILGN